MSRMSNSLFTVAISFLAAATAPVSAQSRIFKKTVKGTPVLMSINVISFGPNGLLLIGDGRGSQIVAIATGDTKAQKFSVKKIEAIVSVLAGKIGTTSDGIEILDMAVNPASKKVYFAIRKQDTKKHLILTVDGSGKVSEFQLDKVTHASLILPKGEKAPVNRITDVAWAGDRVIASARANEEFASKVFVVPAPLSHEAKADIYSAETYHVSHRRWETKAPMSVIIPFDEGGEKYVIGAFSCTPVVKYPISKLQPGAKVKGISVIELGSGNRPLDMLAYEKGGKSYVLANTYRFHHKKRPFGPSPYWTVRFERDLLGENSKINEKALRRLGSKGPSTDRITMVEAYHGVTQMDKLDSERAIILRASDAKKVDLEVIGLP